MNERSILTSSTGRSRSRDRVLCPVPKSSSASCTPRARSSLHTARLAAVSASRCVSVISRQSCSPVSPWRASSAATICGSSCEASWPGVMFTATRRSAPPGRPVQRASWCRRRQDEPEQRVDQVARLGDPHDDLGETGRSAGEPSGPGPPTCAAARSTGRRSVGNDTVTSWCARPARAAAEGHVVDLRELQPGGVQQDVPAATLLHGVHRQVGAHSSSSTVGVGSNRSTRARPMLAETDTSRPPTTKGVPEAGEQLPGDPTASGWSSISTANSSPPNRASVSASDSRRGSAGPPHQQVVAGTVPQLVVDRLEAVEVEEADRQRALVAAVQLEGVGGAVDEQGAVGQPGQRVVEGLVAQLGLAVGEGPGEPLVVATVRNCRKNTSSTSTTNSIISTTETAFGGGHLPGHEAQRATEDDVRHRGAGDRRQLVVLALHVAPGISGARASAPNARNQPRSIGLSVT